MVEIIARKYTKAIIESVTLLELREFLIELRRIEGAFYSEKFLEIIRSPYISRVFKEEFIIELLNTKSDRLINFIKLLVVNHRLTMLPSICSAIQTYVNEQDKKYLGLLFLNKRIESKTLEEIAQNLSRRLGVGLILQQVVINFEGIRLVINDLNLEISFSRDNFLNSLRHHILKAI